MATGSAECTSTARPSSKLEGSPHSLHLIDAVGHMPSVCEPSPLVLTMILSKPNQYNKLKIT